VLFEISLRSDGKLGLSLCRSQMSASLVSSRNRELERRSFTNNRFDPDPASVTLDNLPAKRQADSATRNLVTMQPFKRLSAGMPIRYRDSRHARPSLLALQKAVYAEAQRSGNELRLQSSFVTAEPGLFCRR
jgi:hypothetical protein